MSLNRHRLKQKIYKHTPKNYISFVYAIGANGIKRIKQTGGRAYIRYTIKTNKYALRRLRLRPHHPEARVLQHYLNHINKKYELDDQSLMRLESNKSVTRPVVRLVNLCK